MSNRSLDQLAKRRRLYTNEDYCVARTEIAKRPPGSPIIPTASPQQALFELTFLTAIAHRASQDEGGWTPGCSPFGIERLTPRTDSLDIVVESIFLPTILNDVLPYCIDSHPENLGITGLRVHHIKEGIELRRLGLPGMIRLIGKTRKMWWAGVNAYLLENSYGEAYSGATWLHSPSRMHPIEEETAWGYIPGYAPVRPDITESAAMASQFLRRHLIFRNPPFTTGINAWVTGAVQVEWFDGPSHRAVMDYLLDPVFGLADTASDGPCDDCDVSCQFIHLTPAGAFGINLRRALHGATSKAWIRRVNAGYRHRRKASLAAFLGANRLIPPHEVDVVLPPHPPWDRL